MADTRPLAELLAHVSCGPGCCEGGWRCEEMAARLRKLDALVGSWGFMNKQVVREILDGKR